MTTTATAASEIMGKIKELLGPAPIVTSLPETLVLTPKPGEESVKAAKFGRELALMKADMPGKGVDDFVVMRQGATTYNVIYAEQAGEKYFLFVEQYRVPLTKQKGEAKIFADFPGGYFNTKSGEVELDAVAEALRELAEETGISKEDITVEAVDTKFLDGIYTVRKDPDNIILLGKYDGELDLQPKLYGNKAEGERTVRVWYSEAEVKNLLRAGRFGTPGVVSYVLLALV